MSWEEYNDMFDDAQKRGRYRVFVFDVKNSKKLGYDLDKITQLIDQVCKKIQKIEAKESKKIIYMPEYLKLRYIHVLGDMFSLTVYNDSISPEVVYKLFKKEKQRLGITTKFHFDDGVYETNSWCLGKYLYYRDYCIQLLESRSKSKKETI